MVTITFSVSMVNLKNITDETTDSLRFCDLKKKKKNFFSCATGEASGSHTASADVSVDTDMVTLAILTVLLMQLSAAL